MSKPTHAPRTDTDGKAHVVCRDCLFETVVARTKGAVEEGTHRASHDHRVAWDVIDR